MNYLDQLKSGYVPSGFNQTPEESLQYSEVEQFTEGRSEVLKHFNEHFKRAAYENQPGSHAYWFDPKEHGKGMTAKQIHEHLASKGIKTKHIPAVTKYDQDTVIGQHGKHGFQITPKSHGGFHIGFHKSQRHAQGLDSLVPENH